MSEKKKRLQGLRALLVDAVAHGASAIERVHLATAARPFAVLAHTPVAAPAAVVRLAHDTATRAVYATIRGVTQLAGAALAVAIDAAVPDESAPPDADGEDGAPATARASADPSDPAAARSAGETPRS